MGKTRNDEIYEEGVKEGKEGNIFSDFAQGVSKDYSTSKEDEIYDKGYEQGVNRRYEESSTSSDDGFCYLTTACIESMGLPDDCYELTTLRNFRDRVLLPTSLGKRSVGEYYKIAPEIVQTVGEKGKDIAVKIWNNTYRDIKKAVSLILSNDFNGSFQHYQQMTLDLKEKHLR